MASCAVFDRDRIGSVRFEVVSLEDRIALSEFENIVGSFRLGLVRLVADATSSASSPMSPSASSSSSSLSDPASESSDSASSSPPDSFSSS